MLMIRCPRCNSRHIYPVAGGYGGWTYRCKDCGYAGPLVVEFDAENQQENQNLQRAFRHEMNEMRRRQRPYIWLALLVMILLIALAFFLLL
jgi:transposase-like protein